MQTLFFFYTSNAPHIRKYRDTRGPLGIAPSNELSARQPVSDGRRAVHQFPSTRFEIPKSCSALKVEAELSNERGDDDTVLVCAVV